jgi:uracil-DNA glycosylase
MFIDIDDSWKSLLKDTFEAPYFGELMAFVASEYQTKTCYPPKQQIFAAFNACKLQDLKVVIIGQDPYHGASQANGLSFSVNDGITLPPSLRNIFKEIETDLQKPFPNSGNLERWANQGVLLLNATLTVEQSKPGSHQNRGWESFTDTVIKAISENKENIVFLLWGGFAKTKSKLIDPKKHHILTSGHPSPMSANRGYWFGNKHFSTSNAFLKSKGIAEIDW